MNTDPRIDTLGRDSLAASQENLYSVEKPTVPGTLQNESQELEMQDQLPEAVITEPYHLPECHYVKDTDNVQYGWNDCICPELRACEQRVLRDAIDAMDAVDAQYEVNPDWVLWEVRTAIEALKEKP